MGAFVAMSLMNYYAVFALIMVFIVAWFSFDIGSMARLERAALNEIHDEPLKQVIPTAVYSR